MSIKFYILVVLSFLMGFVFLGVGIYFLSKKFLEKLNQASSQNAELLKHNQLKAKGSGYVALALGALTLVWAILFLLIPSAIPLLALIYMIFLIISFAFLTFVFR